MIIVVLALWTLSSGLAYYCGRLGEWHKVVRYLQRHEKDRHAGWITSGIIADCHRKGDGARWDTP